MKSKLRCEALDCTKIVRFEQQERQLSVFFDIVSLLLYFDVDFSVAMQAHKSTCELTEAFSH